MFEQVQAVLFDFDGTLIEQHIDFQRMRQDVWGLVARYGLDPTPLSTMYVLELIAHVSAALAKGSGDGVTGAERSRAFAAEAKEAVLDIELQAADGAIAFPGVPQMLEQLCAWGLGVGIVTRNSRPAVERVLAQNDMRYGVLLTRDDVAQVKPDPRHLLAALEQLGVSGERAMMCGDHPMDVLAGRRVGAMTVGVLPVGRSTEYFAEVPPDAVVNAVTEITGLIRPPT